MNHRTNVTGSKVIGVVAGLALAWLAAAPAWSIPEAPGARRVETTAGLLHDVRVHIEGGRLDAALALADTVDPARLDAAGRMELRRMIGYARARQGDFSGALEAYEALLKDGRNLDAAAVSQTRYAAAQLCFALERFDEAVNHLLAWREAEQNDAGFGPYILLGQAYFKVGAVPDAISALETGLDRARLEGARIREHWLRLLHHLYVDQQRWRDAAAVKERLARL